MAPTNAIKDQMYRYIAGEEPTTERPAKMIAEEQFPNLRIILYPSLLRMKNEIMENLNPDIIIMDELHITGADKWGEKIEQENNRKVLAEKLLYGQIGISELNETEVNEMKEYFTNDI